MMTPTAFRDDFDPIDAFEKLSLPDRQAMTGKVLIVSIPRKQILHHASSLIEARDWLRASEFRNELCRLVEAPPAEPYTLEELAR